MIIHKDIQQGSEEWHDIRCGKITGSAVHDLLTKGGGITRRKRLYKIIAERVTGKCCDSDVPNNIHIRRGHELEDEARLIYEMISGNIVESVGFIESEKVGEEGLLEIKCKDSHTFIEQKIKGEKGIEKKYITQMQFGLYLTSRKYCDYCCYNPNFEKPIIIRIDRDDEYISNIKNEIEAAEQEIKEIKKQGDL